MTEPSKNRFFDWSVASRPLAGNPESGDLAIVLPFAEGVLLGALDGLGHGDEAAAAARAACEVMRVQPDLPVVELVRRCHEALLETRGVVMSLASFNAQDRTLTWTGVGNVEGLLVRADKASRSPHETLLLHGGVVGFNLPSLTASVLSISPGDTLVFATDGIRSGFGAGLGPTDAPLFLANRILALHAKDTDDALALVAVFLGGEAS